MMRDFRYLNDERQPTTEEQSFGGTQARYSYASYPASQSSKGRSGSKRKKTIKKVIGAVLITGVVLLLGMTPFLLGWAQAIEREGRAGAEALEQAVHSLSVGDATQAKEQFARAETFFLSARERIGVFGIIFDLGRYIPGASRPASGKNLIEAGAHLARAGSEAGIVIGFFLEPKTNPSGTEESRPLLRLLLQSDPVLERVARELKEASEALARVDVEDVPDDKRAALEEIRETLPQVTALLDGYLKRTPLFEELLGAAGPRKYLFLFQNNQELRPTGGFIGSYARLDLTDGVIKRFFIDGIFNPDGQLKENIVPPKPIQKVSAGWSLHDSNWFPDFPTSAEKAIFFYEKTGGPTVDGVVTITPTLLGKLLELTGPIPLPEYGVTISAENFIPVVQEEVEVKYDREENQPKKILSDLAQEIFARLLIVPSLEHFRGVAEAVVEGLNERHIILYSRQPETQALLDEAGWSGRVLTAPHNFLMVVHSNINGYKTDGVIDDSINHISEVQADGSIIDTVSITRHHRGGNTPYTWWNKVNANYLRVYVPLGSTLLSAEGMTREFPPAPLDYDALAFRRDDDVIREERSIVIDETSGTRIGEESGKTVYGNWVYVSPGESVTVTYRYMLPLRLSPMTLKQGEPNGYSVLYQKQSGTSGASLLGKVIFPKDIEPVWQTGKNLVRYERTWQYSTTLEENRFYGWALSPRAAPLSLPSSLQNLSFSWW